MKNMCREGCSKSSAGFVLSPILNAGFFQRMDLSSSAKNCTNSTHGGAESFCFSEWGWVRYLCVSYFPGPFDTIAPSTRDQLQRTKSHIATSHRLKTAQRARIEPERTRSINLPVLGQKITPVLKSLEETTLFIELHMCKPT